MYFAATVLCGVIFTAFAVLSPYIAVLVRSLGFSQTATGLLLGAAEISAIAAPFFFGAWADKKNDYKKALLVVSLLSIASSAVLFWVKSPLVCALVIPLLSAGYRSAIPLSDAVITVSIGREGNYGRVRAVGSITYVIMVLILQLTPVFRPVNAANIVFWNILATSLVIAVLLRAPVSFLRPARTPSALPADGEHGKGNTATGLPGAERSIWTPVFTLGIVIIFLNRLAFSPLQTYLSLYSVEYLQWDAVGLLAAIAAFSETPFIFLSAKLIKRYRALNLLVITTAVVAVRLTLVAFFPYKGILMAAQVLHALTFGVFHPAAVAFVAANIPPEKRAAGMTVYMSLGTGLPTFMGNIAGGAIIERLGYRALFSGFAFFALLALFVYFFAGKKARQSGQ
jgi:PPP family 3-phenylpropionic acid transporter